MSCARSRSASPAFQGRYGTSWNFLMAGTHHGHRPSITGVHDLPARPRARHRSERTEGLMPDADPPAWRCPIGRRDAVFYQIFPERFANGDPSLDPPDVGPLGRRSRRATTSSGATSPGITAHLDHIESGRRQRDLPDADLRGRHQPPLRREGLLRDRPPARRPRGVPHVPARGARPRHPRGAGCGAQPLRGRPPGLPRRGRARAGLALRELVLGRGLPIARRIPSPTTAPAPGATTCRSGTRTTPRCATTTCRSPGTGSREGIDGWRLDVPYFINHTFWREFREVVKGESENLYVVAEEWRDPGGVAAGRPRRRHDELHAAGPRARLHRRSRDHRPRSSPMG